MIDSVLLHAALDALDVGISLVGLDGRIRYCNAAYADLLDVPPELLVGASILGAAAPCEGLAERAAEIAEGLPISLSGETSDGIAVEVVVRPLDEQAGVRLVLVRRGLVRATPPRWLPLEVVEDLRSFLGAVTGHAFDDASLSRAPLSIMVLAVENLEEVRRLRGEEKTEDLLRRVAQVLVLEKRKSDVVSRYGVGQFLVLAPDTPGHRASLLAERFRRGVDALDLEPEGQGGRLRLRMTTTEYRPQLDGTIRDAVERAASTLSSPASSPHTGASRSGGLDVDMAREEG